MFLLNVLLLTVALAPSQPADAVSLEREARHIETMLMAPCCWAQPVSQHQSQASEDVKHRIRVLLAAGKSRQEVLDGFVAQFGRRILVEPPVRGFGVVLYGGLAVAFLLTGALLVVWVRRASRRPAEATAAASADGSAEDAAYVARLDDELRDMD